MRAGFTRTGSPGSGIRPALTAGMIDLADVGSVRLQGSKLATTAGAGPAHPVLAHAHEAIAASRTSRSVGSWLKRLPRRVKPIYGLVATELIERGVLTRQRDRVLGVLPRERFPRPVPSPPRFGSAWVTCSPATPWPQDRDRQLLALVVAVELVDRLVPRHALPAARACAEQIAAEDHAAQPRTRNVQQEVVAAITAEEREVRRLANWRDVGPSETGWPWH